MFDGSHRSRRTIDLSGGNRRRHRRRRGGDDGAAQTSFPYSNHHPSSISNIGNITTSSSLAAGIPNHKAQVLQSTLQQREERRIQQERQRCAKNIQRIVRGYQTKKRVATTTFPSTAAAECSTRNVSLRLSPSLQPFLTISTRQLLLNYQVYIQQCANVQSELTSVVAVRRILVAACRLLTQQQEEEENEKIQFVLDTICTNSQPCTWGVEGYMALVTACQELLWNNNNHNNHHNNDFILSLWKWSCQAAIFINTRFAVALLGVTLFCCTSEPNSPCVPHTMLKATCPVAPDALLSLLVECLIPGTSHVEMSRADALLRDAIVQRVDGRQGILLINALSLLNNNNNKNHETPHAAVLQLLQHLLSQQSELQVLASLVAGKGAQYVKDVVLGNDFAKTTATDMQVDGGESDDDDDENEEEQQQQRVRAPPAVTLLTGAQRKAASSALSRSQLQTTPKLDRLHQELVSRQEQNVIQMLQSQPISYRQHMVDLAIAIGNATFWKEWGIQILKHSPTTTTKDDAPLLLRQSYLHVLHMLLQSCTGLRTATSSSSSSPLLSQLAFDGEWLEALWRNVLVLVAAVNGSDSSQEEFTLVVATTLFSNAFAHRLIALSDDEFLQQYTMTRGDDASRRVSILAEHVIVHLRTMLYDLYWNKPVLAQDVGSADSTTLKAHRARLLLSGTKLWNSLYERWCRLVRRAPFCDEATWCFPRLTSRAADDRAAVLHIVHDRPNDNDSDDDDSVVVAMQVERPSDAELQNDALADSFRDPKMARILTCIPQALPFERRVKLFSSLLAADKIKTQDETTEFHRALQRMMEMGRDMDDIMDMAGREQVEIRRDALYSDSKEQLSRLGNRLKRRVQVTFINQHGAPEAGIDGGGVFKEFLDDLIKEAFDPSQQKTKGAPALFSVTPAETLAVNMATAQSEEALPHYEFLGRVLGKAVYESILVEPQFCLPFLNQLLGKQNSLEDLKNLDNEYYTNLTKLRTLSAAEIDSLGMTFEMTLESGDGARRTVELLPGGSSMPVTKANVIQYVHLVAHQRLNVQAAKPTRAFLRGFRDLIPASWVRLFSAYELQKMISGDDTVRGIDVASLKAAMQYAAGYHPSQEIVQWFWEVIDELTPDQQRKFLRFMTSCSRQPLLGFQSLAPAPCIQQIRLPENMFQDDDEAEKTMPLPTSATCMNLLKLPNYRNKNLLRKKLVAAIESGAGFELT